MMFWKRKKEEAPKPMEEVKHLVLTIGRGKRTGHKFTDTRPYEGGSKVEPFKNFYHWFFGRPQSRYYRYMWGAGDGGEILLFREQINNIKIEVEVTLEDVVL